MKRGREREKEKNGGKVIFKYSYQKKKKKMCRASKTLATEWDKGDKKSCENERRREKKKKKKNETNLGERREIEWGRTTKKYL